MMAANAGMAQAVHAGGYDSDVENGRSAQNNAAAMGSSFGDKAIRRAFIKKVYGILTIQLLVTCGIIGIIINPNWPIKQYVQQNQWVYLSSFGLMMVSKDFVMFLYHRGLTFDPASGLHDRAGVLRGREEEVSRQHHRPRNLHL